MDEYGRPHDESPYTPFYSDLVKELPADAPEVALTDDLPQIVVDVISAAEKMIRELAPEEENEFQDMCSKYDHFGGSAREWSKFHHRPDVTPLFS